MTTGSPKVGKIRRLKHSYDQSDLILRANLRQLSGPDRLLMIDLLFQLAYIALVLAVISLFICTLPVWLIVLVVVLLLR